MLCRLTLLTTTLLFGLASASDQHLEDLIKNGIDMAPGEYVSVSFQGTKIAQFNYPPSTANF